MGTVPSVYRSLNALTCGPLISFGAAAKKSCGAAGGPALKVDTILALIYDCLLTYRQETLYGHEPESYLGQARWLR